MAAALALEDAKKRAAAKAVELVEPGMRLGLGTGSTAAHFVALLGERVAAGLRVICVPTSEHTAAQAAALGIALSTLEETPALDLTVDGADEVDPKLRLIKGGGGALLREKIVAAASARMIVIADATKLVAELGQFPLPVEVVPFGLESTRRKIVAAGERAGVAGTLAPRRTPEGHAFVTDGGHLILDCHFGRIPDPEGLAAALSAIPGVVEHGLFIGLAAAAICAGADGITILGRLG